MNIRRKFVLGLTLITFFVILNGVMGIVSTKIINQNLNVVTRVSTPTIETVNDLIIFVWQNTAIIQAFAGSEDPGELAELKGQFKNLNHEFEKAKTIALNLASDEDARNKIGIATENYGKFKQGAEQIFAVHEKELQAGAEDERQQLKEEVEELTKNAVKHAKDAVEPLNEVEIRAYIANKVASDQSHGAVQRTVLLLTFMILISVGCALGIVVYLSQSIIHPINRLADAATKVSEGNFEVKVAERKENDELANLVIIFNKMVESLKNLLRESPHLKQYVDLSPKKQAVRVVEYPLMPRTSYLVKDASPKRAYSIIANRIAKGSQGLCISREVGENLRKVYGLPEMEFILLSDVKVKDKVVTSNLQQLKKLVVDFMEKKDSAIILLDRIDYLISKYGFGNVLAFVTEMNDMVMMKNAILLIPVDPSFMNPRNLSFLEKELKEVPLPQTQEALAPELEKLLAFVKNRQVFGKLASFKDIGKEFGITAPTTLKRVKELEEKGYIEVSKEGRNKLIKAIG